MSAKSFEALFRPIMIGDCEIKNRILQCAMDPGPFVTPDGRFEYRTKNLLETRAKGGVGVIVTGCTYVEKGINGFFSDDEDIFLEPASEMAENIHSFGCKLFGQISAGVGRNLITNMGPVDSDMLIAPSGNTPNFFDPAIRHREISKERIRHIIVGFEKTAALMKKAGFDGVEVHALHEGYMLDEFAIASINRREDEYGGSLDNRLRLAGELLDAVKRVCGKGFPVTIRFSVESKMKGYNSGALPGEIYDEFGRDINEAVEVAKKLEKMGYDGLNADNGSYDAWYWAHPPVYMPHMCNLPDAASIKSAVSIPVFCAGRMDDPYGAAKAVEDGRIDGIAIGRALLADPEFPNKLMNGEPDDIRPCIACHSGCLRTFLGEPMTCALNPDVGNGNEEKYEKTRNPLKIAVIGGGIGGMEFARVCALEGHNVDLFEKSDRLGGVFNAAAAPDFKEADKRLIVWYNSQMEKCGVNVTLNREIRKADELAEYDLTAAATGALPKSLHIKGIDGKNLISATDALLENRSAGKTVSVIGGGLTGCEIAYWLAKKGRRVNVIEFLPDILSVRGLCRSNSSMLRDLLRRYNVRILTNTSVESIDEKGVTVKNETGTEKLECETVIIATGYTPNDVMYEKLSGAGIRCLKIGDAAEVGNLLLVIKGARTAAREMESVVE